MKKHFLLHLFWWQIAAGAAPNRMQIRLSVPDLIYVG